MIATQENILIEPRQKLYHFSLEVYIFPEKDYYIAYCPSFELTTSGENHNDAIQNFYECFQLHTETCIGNGTFVEDLIDHGWKMRKEEPTPPPFSYLIKNTLFKELLASSTPYEKVVIPARVAV